MAIFQMRIITHVCLQSLIFQRDGGLNLKQIIHRQVNELSVRKKLLNTAMLPHTTFGDLTPFVWNILKTFDLRFTFSFSN